MALIRNLKNLFTGNTIYPVTKTRAVYDDDGRRLDSYLKQLQGTPESNILINTNFANPVNQRGETTMASTGSASVGKYWIDRWSAKSFSTSCTYSVDKSSQCIKLYYDKSSTTPSSIKQLIEFPETYGGKTLTLSALMKHDFLGNTMSMQICYVLNGTTTSADAKITVAGEWEELETSLYIPYGITELSVILYAPYAYNTTSGNGYVKWVKLEEGEVKTSYVPRLYADELQLCQRYFQLWTPTSIKVRSSTSVIFFGQFNSVMRTVPKGTLVNDSISVTNITRNVLLKISGTVANYSFSNSSAYWIGIEDTTLTLVVGDELHVSVNHSPFIQLDSEL